jgi:anti-sigma regulatory factor (Ser/Thr protein kinase)
MDPTLAPGPRRAAPGGACRLASTHVLPATAASVPVLRRLAQRTARRWQLPDDTCEALALVVTELVTNAVRHSGSPDVTLRLCLAEGGLTVQVGDSGVWRPRARSVPASGAAWSGEDLACGGRGLVLVEACAVNCDVRTTAEGTTVTAELVVALPAEAVHAAPAEAIRLTGPTAATDLTGLPAATGVIESAGPIGPVEPAGASLPSPCPLSRPGRPGRPGLPSLRYRTPCTFPA